MAFSLLATILLEAFLPEILQALNTPAETYGMAYSYLAVYIPEMCIRDRSRVMRTLPGVNRNASLS